LRTIDQELGIFDGLRDRPEDSPRHKLGYSNDLRRSLIYDSVQQDEKTHLESIKLKMKLQQRPSDYGKPD